MSRCEPTCRCNDPEVLQVVDLMGAGYDQRTASLMVWDPEHPDAAPAFGDSRSTWSRWIAIDVRRIANAARRALGLRPLPALPDGGAR